MRSAVVSTDSEKTFVVEGMTCGHCRAAVLSEVGALAGVAAVDVDLESGRMVVRGEPLDDTAIVAAVVEAGYEVRP
jgi:copper chaperone CopZ